MKKLLPILLIVSIALLICGCQSKAPESEITLPHTQAPTDKTSQAPTDETTEPSPDTQQTEPEETVYPTVRLHAAVKIFDGPSYDSGYVQTVGIDSIYTIVDQVQDDEGNDWGKLKSGIGWVDLTKAAAEEQNMPAVTAALAEPALLESGNYHKAGEAMEDTIAIILRPQEALTKVSVAWMELMDDGYAVADSVIFMEELTPDKPLVVYVTFPGDLTAYGIFCTDSQGVAHRYLLTESGRNGTLEMEEILE